MKIRSYKQKVIQKSFAKPKAPPIEANPKVLASWSTNLSRLEDVWRSACLNKKSHGLDKVKQDFFKASFEFRQQLHKHSNLPPKTILELEKRLEAFTNEIRKM